MYIFGIIAAATAIATTVPYALDVVRGRVEPARSTRLMMFLLMGLALWQQAALGSGWILGLSVGEGLTALVLLLLAIRHGTGGLSREDKLCYALLAASLVVWWQSSSPLWALCCTIVGDMVAFWPTLHKTWLRPESETSIFYWGGVVSAVLTVFADANPTAGMVLFPLYIALANLLEVLLIAGWPQRLVASLGGRFRAY